MINNIPPDPFVTLANELWWSLFGDSTRDVPLAVYAEYTDTPPRTIRGPKDIRRAYRDAAEAYRMAPYAAQAEPLAFWKRVMECAVKGSYRFPELDGLIAEHLPGLRYLPAACVGPMAALFQALNYIKNLPGIRVESYGNDSICLAGRDGDKTVYFGCYGGLLYREVKRWGNQLAYRRAPTALWQGQTTRVWVAPASWPNGVRLGLRGASLARYLRGIRRADETVWFPCLALLEAAKALNHLPAACRFVPHENPEQLDYFRLALAQVKKVDSPILTRRQLLYMSVVPHWLDHERFVETFGDPLDLFETHVNDDHVIEKINVILANAE